MFLSYERLMMLSFWLYTCPTSKSRNTAAEGVGMKASPANSRPIITCKTMGKKQPEENERVRRESDAEAHTPNGW